MISIVVKRVSLVMVSEPARRSTAASRDAIGASPTSVEGGQS